MPSSGRSRMMRAARPLIRQEPAQPRLTRSISASPAATAGQAPAGVSASMQWVIELPWNRTRLRVSGHGAQRRPSAMASSVSETVAVCGSQTSTALSPAGRSTVTAAFSSPLRTPSAPIAAPPTTVAAPCGLPLTKTGQAAGRGVPSKAATRCLTVRRRTPLSVRSRKRTPAGADATQRVKTS